MFAEDYTAYRRQYLLTTIIPSLVVPVLGVTLLVRFFLGDVSWILLLFLRLVSVPIWGAIRVKLEGAKQAKEAQKLGAVPIPKVVGRWPGNLDIMIAAMKGIKERYLQEYLDSLFDEYQTDTLNLRLLWGDHVRPNLLCGGTAKIGSSDLHSR